MPHDINAFKCLQSKHRIMVLCQLIDRAALEYADAAHS